MSGSTYYPPKNIKRRRPRSGGKSVVRCISFDPAVDLIVRRELAALGISAGWFFEDAAKEHALKTYNEREKGLVPIPGWVATEELALIRSRADAAGVSAWQYIIHAALDRAARPAPAPTPSNDDRMEDMATETAA